MSLMKPVVVVALLVFFVFSESNGEIVETANGQVQGIEKHSRLGEPFHAFYSIPFAEPPVGELRFKPPVPIANWTGIHDATVIGNQCVHANARTDMPMDEDCLVLNVFSKNLTAAIPVIVFIHGGSFEAGTSYDQGGPENLMDREIVLVTINYRLGALGFLATGTAELPGNDGMKDQVLALKWVQNNIAHFGGNPTRVTLTGLSAGAVSATAHMVSPMSQGLFHGVIGMSAAVTGAMPLATQNLDIAEKIGRNLSCTTDNVDQLISCLRTKDALAIMSVVVKDHPDCQVAVWMMTVEPDFEQERFLAADPVELFASGNFSRVPVIIGRTADEFVNVVPGLLNNADELKELNENFEVMGPKIFYYEKNTPKSIAISRALNDSYLPFDQIDVRSFNALGNLFADSLIGYPVHRFVHLTSNVTDVYYYKFTYAGRFSFFNYPRPFTPYGIHHVDDLQYVFYADFMNWFLPPFGPIQPADPEHFMVEHMTRIWEHFAYNGNPNYDVEKINWPKHNASTEFYLDIGTHFVEKNGLLLERYSVWDRALASTAEQKSFSVILLAFVAVALMWQ